MLQRMKKPMGITLIIAAVIAIAATGDYVHRCMAPPLSREEASERALARLEKFKKSFGVREVFTLTESSFDKQSSAWIFSFTSKDCTVMIVTDRCHGDDIGGLTACGST